MVCDPAGEQEKPPLGTCFFCSSRTFQSKIRHVHTCLVRTSFCEEEPKLFTNPSSSYFQEPPCLGLVLVLAKGAPPPCGTFGRDGLSSNRRESEILQLLTTSDRKEARRTADSAIKATPVLEHIQKPPFIGQNRPLLQKSRPSLAAAQSISGVSNKRQFPGKRHCRWSGRFMEKETTEESDDPEAAVLGGNGDNLYLRALSCNWYG
jgi:hypothetical protein